MKIPVELLEKSQAEYDKAPREIDAIRARNAEKSAIELDTPEHVERRTEMLAATAPEDIADAFERYIGTNDLLSFNYLTLGALHGRAVGRIRYIDKREGKLASATGFLVSPELMLTNHHVFPVADVAALRNFAEEPVIEFGYEFGIDGAPLVPVTYDLDPDTFFHAFHDLDMALVAVRGTDRSGAHKIGEQGYLVLNGAMGKAGLGDFATIIQHADGRPKQVSLRNNELIDITLPDVIIYASDTAPGSSGAPVFNNEWQVIALHSAGVPKKNAAGQYLDRNDQVIEPVNGRVDGNRVVWVSNRGIRVSAIMRHLQGTASLALHPLVQALFSPAYTDSRPFAHLALPSLSTERVVAVPATDLPAPAAAPPINIQITIGAGGGVTVTDARTTGALAAAAAANLGLEEEKLLEDAQDFSRCEGYQEDFLGAGFRVPLPTPNARLRKKLAFRTDSPGSYLLKYHHYTAAHHALRRVPAFSAINVHGKYRYAALGKESRKDKWLRDNRIDYDVQLDDDWYAKSGFDKGHLSRREDAEWGTTMAAAKRAADMTCSYANAIPQVPALNRAIFGYHGLWGTLEGKLLEEGVTGESGQDAKISVFSGPLFEDDDPVFRGVQVALSCFKVVAWFDGDGHLRTTCFKLTQVDLVGEIEFEVLQFDKVFKTYQVPLKQIEKQTGLKFPAVLHDAETPVDDEVEVDEVLFERMLGQVRKG